MALYQIGNNYVNGEAKPVYLVCGNAVRNAEITDVNGKTLGKVSVAAQSNPDGSTVFVTVNAWRGRSKALAAVNKMDTLLAIGVLKQREYNGKSYYDLDADFISVNATGGNPTSYNIGAEDFADSADEDLPF
jgi:hypothetical protein